MARIQIVATVGAAADSQGRTGVTSFLASGGSTAHSNLATHLSTLATDQATLATNQTAFESALSTCVADGATPTQAHVTAANSAYTTMKSNLSTVTADIALVAADGATVATAFGNHAVLDIDLTKVTTSGHLKSVFDALLRAARGSGILTS